MRATPTRFSPKLCAKVSPDSPDDRRGGHPSRRPNRRRITGACSDFRCVTTENPMSVNPKHQNFDSQGLPFVPAELAVRFELKPVTENGSQQYRGKNFLDPNGSQSHQFVLHENGVAHDHKLNVSYAPPVIAKFLGIGLDPQPSLYTTRAAKNATRKKQGFDWSNPTALYPYHDEKGTLLYEIGRCGHGEGKMIRPRRPDARREATGNGGWVYQLGNVRRVLYRLQQVIAAKRVLIVEGEKAADFIHALLEEYKLAGEFAVTTNVGGALKWLDEYTPFLSEKDVYVFADEGTAGAAHALDVATRVVGVAKSLRLISLPDLPPKGGADDWLSNGRAIAELLEVAEATPCFTLEAGGTSAVAEPAYSLDDIGNGQRFADEHKHDLRFCSTRESWQVYKNGRWTNDEHGAAETRAKQTARRAVDEAANCKDLDARFKLLRHATTLTKRATRSTMIQDASSEEGIRVVASDFDTDPYLFNCANGTIDLNTCEFREHRPEDLLTHQSPVLFDAAATAPVWERAMERWMPDPAKRRYVQDCVGATLCGVVYDESWNLIFGEGENGKSKFLFGLERMMGSYWHKTEAETFMLSRDPKKSSAPNPSLLALKGARLVTAHELDNTQKMAGAVMKDITGRDSITARGVHEKRPVTFRPQFTLWLTGNSKPVVNDSSHGFWRRVRLIEFAEALQKHERDPQLEQKIEAELSGILNWALEGWRRVQRYGLVVPDVVSMATARYRAEQDPLLEFINDSCKVGYDETATSKELWDAWRYWCEDNLQDPRSEKWLGTQLKERKYTNFKSGSVRKWRGISVEKSFAGNVSHVSHASLSQSDGTDGTDGTLIPENSSPENKPQKRQRGRHQDSEPYGQ